MKSSDDTSRVPRDLDKIGGDRVGSGGTHTGSEEIRGIWPRFGQTKTISNGIRSGGFAKIYSSGE